MAKQLNVDLNFTANTSQAKTQMQELQMLLQKISVGSNIKVDPAQLKQASAAAQELSIHLNNAFNANTGRFDLSKLDKSLKTSKMNVTDLSTQLLKAGAVGEQAFVKLAQSIAAADRPMITLSSKMSGFLTVLKNTARWQISSSVLHGFIGSVQQAYGYAQDLNESLNNIRIVTGNSVDQMKNFAIEANKAAKALSTTTTAYTNASLIYYQQGLSDSEVKERTDVTIKMANAAGQSAEIVSDQMTAVWNNFYDGSKSLESYADAMTALGAATASSTDEIATGLEKFASVAETVGLSYKYATAALATVTATTRQSADVVGTAFKTLFARLNDLKLGETLEDGTTLGQYTENLAKVGVNIKDASGQLKDMDVILEETAAKWQNLDRDQQTALAKGVAGIRQYNQFIALMDNWDFMEENLQTVEDSEGTLQEQADIYAESWEAASKRVKASLETIYSQLLDDEFFIDINNGFASMLDSVGAFIDGIGGVKTIIMYISSLLLNSFAHKIPGALSSFGHTFSVMFQTAEQQAQGLAAEMNKIADETLKSDIGKGFSQSSKTAVENAMQLNNAKSKLMVVEKSLTDTEKQRYQQQLNMISVQQEETQKVAERIDKLKEEKNAILDKNQVTSLTNVGQDTANKLGKNVLENVEIYKNSYKESAASGESATSVEYAREAYERASQAAKQFQQTQNDLIGATTKVNNAFVQMGDSLDLSKPEANIRTLQNTIQSSFGEAIQNLNQRLRDNSAIINENGASFTSFQNSIEMVVGSMPEIVRESDAVQTALTDLYAAKDSKDLKNVLDQISNALKKTKINAEDFRNILKEINPKAYKELEENAKQTSKAIEELTKRQQAINQAVKNFKPTHTVSSLEAVTKTAAGLGQVAMAIQSVRSAWNAWSNDDLSIGEKITTTLMSISMIVPSVIGAFNSFKTVLLSLESVQSLLAASTQAHMVSMAAESAVIAAKTTGYSKASLAVIAHKMATEELTGAELLEYIQAKLGCDAKQAQVVANSILDGMNKKLTLSTIMSTAATKLNTAAEEGNLLAKLAVAAGGATAQVVAFLVAKAKGVETKAVKANAAAWYANPVMWIGLIIAGAIAAIVALVSWIHKMTTALDEETIAAQQAQAAASNLSAAYDEIKKKYEDMISTMEKYETARDGLNKLTKGTKEYREALDEANKAALELIEIGDLIRGVDYEITNGEIIIKKESLNDAEQKIYNQMADIQNASMLANANAKAANMTYRTNELVKENDISAWDAARAGAIATGGAGALAGAKLGIAAGPYSLVASPAAAAVAGIAGVIGGAIAGYTGTQAINDAANAEETKQIEHIIALYKEIGEAAFDSTTLQKLGFDTTNTSYIDSIKEIARETAAASESISTSSELVAANILQNDAIFKGLNEERQKKISAAAGREYKQEFNKSYETKKNNIKDGDIDKYASKMGLTDLKGFKIVDYDDDGNVKYEYLNDEGKKQELEFTHDEVAIMLASQEAEKELTESTKILIDMFNKFETSLNKADQALANFAGGSLLDSSYEEFKDMKKELSPYIIDEAELSSKGALNYINNNFSTEELAAMGFESANEAAKEFKLQFENALMEWNNIQLPNDLLGIDKASLSLSKNIEKVYNIIGKRSFEYEEIFTQGINKIFEENNLDENEQQTILQALTEIDWSSWNAIYEVSNKLESFGVKIDATDPYWKDFSQNIRFATNSVKDIAKENEKLINVIQKINDLEYFVNCRNRHYFLALQSTKKYL